MSPYLTPAEYTTKAVDAGASKVLMSTRDTLIRSAMAGAILALAAAFAVTITVQTGEPLAGAVLFPVGFVLLYLLGFDLLTGVFMLTPLALLDKRPGVTGRGVLRNWSLVFVGNFMGAFLVAVMRSRSPSPSRRSRTSSARRSAQSARTGRWATRTTVRPACSRSSSAACSATGWSAPA